MAMDLLQQFLGGDQKRQQDYGDFLRRYQENPNGISDEEAAQRYRELMRQAPPDVADEANQYAFGHLPQESRSQLADRYREATSDPNRPYNGYSYDDHNQAADPRNLGRMTRQADEQDPDLFGQIFGQNSPLGGTLGKAALAAGAAYLAGRVFSGQGQPGGLNIPGLGGGQGNQFPGLQRQRGDLDRQV